MLRAAQLSASPRLVNRVPPVVFAARIRDHGGSIGDSLQRLFERRELALLLVDLVSDARGDRFEFPLFLQFRQRHD